MRYVTLRYKSGGKKNLNIPLSYNYISNHEFNSEYDLKNGVRVKIDFEKYVTNISFPFVLNKLE